MANIDDKKIPVGGKETPIPNRLHDVSEDHVVTGANEVFDDAFGERQSQINDKLRHYTKMAHIRIDAEEITRQHEDTQLRNELNAKQLEIGAIETDGEPIPESPNMLPSGAVAFNLGWYRGNENSEWVYCITDGAMRILAGIKKDGSVEWMIGVPTPVKNYIDTHIQELIERLEELEELIIEGLERKVDKEEGKSLINKDYADGIIYIENPEFKEVKLDNEGKILEAIMLDGTKLLPAGTNIQGVVTKVESNPEYLMAILDGVGHILFAIDKDGNVVFSNGVPKSIKKYIDKKFEENTLAIEFEENGDIAAYYGEEGNINDVYTNENGDIIVEQNITVD